MTDEEKITLLVTAIKECLNGKRLYNLSKLLSNPPQNAAVWDIQAILRAVLNKIE